MTRQGCAKDPAPSVSAQAASVAAAAATLKGTGRHPRQVSWKLAVMLSLVARNRHRAKLPACARKTPSAAGVRFPGRLGPRRWTAAPRSAGPRRRRPRGPNSGRASVPCAASAPVGTARGPWTLPGPDRACRGRVRACATGQVTCPRHRDSRSVAANIDDWRITTSMARRGAASNKTGPSIYGANSTLGIHPALHRSRGLRPCAGKGSRARWTSRKRLAREAAGPLPGAGPRRSGAGRPAALSPTLLLHRTIRRPWTARDVAPSPPGTCKRHCGIRALVGLASPNPMQAEWPAGHSKGAPVLAER